MVERDAIVAALKSSDLPLADLAAMLGIHRNTLTRKMSEYGIVDPVPRRGIRAICDARRAQVMKELKAGAA